MDVDVIKSLTKTGGAVGSLCLILYLIVDGLFQEPVYEFWEAIRFLSYCFPLLEWCLRQLFLHNVKSHQKPMMPNLMLAQQYSTMTLLLIMATTGFNYGG